MIRRSPKYFEFQGWVQAKSWKPWELPGPSETCLSVPLTYLLHKVIYRAYTESTSSSVFAMQRSLAEGMGPRQPSSRTCDRSTRSILPPYCLCSLSLFIGLCHICLFTCALGCQLHATPLDHWTIRILTGLSLAALRGKTWR